MMAARAKGAEGASLKGSHRTKNRRAHAGAQYTHVYSDPNGSSSPCRLLELCTRHNNCVIIEIAPQPGRPRRKAFALRHAQFAALSRYAQRQPETTSARQTLDQSRPERCADTWLDRMPGFGSVACNRSRRLPKKLDMLFTRVLYIYTGKQQRPSP